MGDISEAELDQKLVEAIKDEMPNDPVRTLVLNKAIEYCTAGEFDDTIWDLI